MDRKSRQGCIWIGLGVAILVCVVGGGLLGGLAWAAYQSFSFKADFIPPDAAEREFEQARAKFAGQHPLIEVGEDGAARVVPRTAPGGSADVASIHVLVYTPDRPEARTRHGPVLAGAPVASERHGPVRQQRRQGAARGQDHDR